MRPVSTAITLHRIEDRPLTSYQGPRKRGFNAKYFLRCQSALSAIDNAHLDGKLVKCGVYCSESLMPEHYGTYLKPDNEIHLQEGEFLQTTLIHEIGHMLDTKGLGQDKYSSSALNDSLFYEFRKAVFGTPTWKGLSEFGKSGNIIRCKSGVCRKASATEAEKKHAQTYLASIPESFARLYLQWVVSRSSDVGIVLELAQRARTDYSRTFIPFWTQRETEDLFPLLENVFRSLQWLD